MHMEATNGLGSDNGPGSGSGPGLGNGLGSDARPRVRRAELHRSVYMAEGRNTWRIR